MVEPSVIEAHQPGVRQGHVADITSAGPNLRWSTAEYVPELRADEVHIWSFVLDPGRLPLSRFSSALSPEERERAAQFHFKRDRTRFVVGHAILRRLLGRYLAVEPGAVKVSTGSRGKPYLDQGRIQFNLSHSMNLGLAAFSLGGPVGVDVEALRPLADASALVARFFSPRERAAFERLPESEKTAAFYRLWTRKEAWLKATGDGITESLHLVEVSFLPEQEACFRSLPGWAATLGAWRLHALEPAEGFIGAAAVPDASKEIKCAVWSDNNE